VTGYSPWYRAHAPNIQIGSCSNLPRRGELYGAEFMYNVSTYASIQKKPVIQRVTLGSPINIPVIIGSADRSKYAFIKFLRMVGVYEPYSVWKSVRREVGMCICETGAYVSVRDKQHGLRHNLPGRRRHRESLEVWKTKVGEAYRFYKSWLKAKCQLPVNSTFALSFASHFLHVP